MEETQGFRGVYRGVNVALISSATSWGVYMSSYNLLKRIELQNTAGTEKSSLFLGPSFVASVCTVFATNPLVVIRTRMILLNRDSRRSQHTRLQMVPAFSHLMKTEGFGGLFRGAGVSLFAVPQYMLQMLLYELLKREIERQHGSLSSEQYFMSGALSKLVSSAIMYPYQVVRSRVMDVAAESTSMWQVFTQLLRNEGFYGLYRGLSPQLLRVVPHSAISLAVFEYLSGHF